MSLYLRRMWINQPSTLQTHHRLHGRRVLVSEEELELDNIVTVYFTEGTVISQRMDRRGLSDGWPERTTQ